MISSQVTIERAPPTLTHDYSNNMYSLNIYCMNITAQYVHNINFVCISICFSSKSYYYNSFQYWYKHVLHCRNQPDRYLLVFDNDTSLYTPSKTRAGIHSRSKAISGVCLKLPYQPCSPQLGARSVQVGTTLEIFSCVGVQL